MSDELRAVLEEYQKRADSEDALIRTLPMSEIIRRSDEFLLPIGRATATLVSLLIREGRLRRILEIGTSYGYSTLWLAEAAQAIGGTVITLELEVSKAEFARTQISRAGLSGQVAFRTGDARETLQELTGPFDFVLIDLWKDLYVPVFDLVYPKLAPGATIVADNMLFPEEARKHAEAYRQHVRTARNLASVLLVVGSGLEVSRLLPD